MTWISDEEALPALLREDYSLFLPFAFAEIEGGRPYEHNWHIEAIQYQLERLRTGDTRRMIFTMPPRHLKSITISVAWVAWMLGRDPRLRFMCASYGGELAEKHARDCLKIMSSGWFRRAFPDVILSRVAVHDIVTTAGGGRMSTSVGGVVTGRGANFVIMDDLMKADDALSQAEREKVSTWFSNTMNQRGEHLEHSAFILVMQRLHEADLAGELIRKGGWDELRLPAIATHDELIPLTNGRFHQRREGCALHPARQSLRALEARRAEEPYVFASQFQQDPVSREGAFVRADWFGTYDEPPRTGVVVQSWDTAVKTTVRSDWSVGITARYYQGRVYILDVFRKRVEFGQLNRSLRELCRLHNVHRLLIEDAASGQQLIQQLREDAPEGVVRPIAIKPTGDKLARFEAQAGRIQAGTVVLPRSAPWLAGFMAEMTGFPNARHDDQADALAQMLANPPPQISPPVTGSPELIDLNQTYRGSLDPEYDPWSGL